jgi:hypothetical protein
MPLPQVHGDREARYFSSILRDLYTLAYIDNRDLLIKFILVHEPFWLLFYPFYLLDGSFIYLKQLSLLLSDRRHPLLPLFFLVLTSKVSYRCELPPYNGRARRLLLTKLAVRLQVDDHFVCLAAPDPSLFHRAAIEHSTHLFFD